MAIHPQRARSKSLPSDDLDDADYELCNASSSFYDEDVFQTRRRQSAPLVSLIRSSLTTASGETIGQIGGDLATWLRQIEAMDLSFPVTTDSSFARRDVDRCNADFLADTLGFVSVGNDINANKKIGRCRSPTLGRHQLFRRSAAASVTDEVAASSLLPKSTPRRWNACDLPNGRSWRPIRSLVDSEGARPSRKYGVTCDDVTDVQNTDSDDEDVGPDNDDDDDSGENFIDVGPRRRFGNIGWTTGSGRMSPPVYNDVTHDVNGTSTARRVHFRSATNQHYSRLEQMKATVARLPVILEDETSEPEGCDDECDRGETSSVSASSADNQHNSSRLGITNNGTLSLSLSPEQSPSLSPAIGANGENPSCPSNGVAPVVVKPETETKPSQDTQLETVVGSSTAVKHLEGVDVGISVKSSTEQVAVSAAVSQSLLDMMHKKYCSSQYVQAVNRTHPSVSTSNGGLQTPNGSVRCGVKENKVSSAEVQLPPAKRTVGIEISRPNCHENCGRGPSTQIERCRSPGDVSTARKLPIVANVDDCRSASASAVKTSMRRQSADDVLNVTKSYRERGTTGTGTGKPTNDAYKSSVVTVTYSSPEAELRNAELGMGDRDDATVARQSRDTCASTWYERFERCAECDELVIGDQVETDPTYRQRVLEIEAIEACEWLRETGFPQYVQMYRDGRYLIDMEGVRQDHAFLEPDDLDALFRRLRTLEKSARMKLKTARHRNVDESDDDEDLCALSDKWRYQRNNRQWSHLDGNSSTSVASAAAEGEHTVDPQPPCPSLLRSSPSSQSFLSTSAESEATSVNDAVDSRSHPVIEEPQSSSGVCKLSLHLPLRASSSSPIPKTAGVHHRRSGSSSGLPSSVGASRSTEFGHDEIVNGVPSSPSTSSSKDFLAVAAPRCATSLSDSERSSLTGSTSSTSVSPGQPRRAPSDRFRGAWNMLKKVESHLMTRRLSGSRRGASTTNDSSTGSSSSERQMEIGSPTMVETAAVRAKLDSLRCVDINRSSPMTSPSVSSSSAVNGLTPTSPSPSSCAFDSMPAKSASASTVSVESCDSSSSSSQQHQQQQQYCSRTLPNPRHQRHRHLNGHSKNSVDDTALPETVEDVVAPLLSMRNLRSLLLGNEDSSSGAEGHPTGSQANATRISVYDNVQSATPCVSSMTTVTLRSPNALTTFQTPSDGEVDVTSSTLTDAERELDAILSSLYNDISWLSKTLAVVTEERDADSFTDSPSTSGTIESDAPVSASSPAAVDVTPAAEGQLMAVSMQSTSGSCTLVSCSEAESPDSGSDPKEDDWSYPDDDLQQRERRDSGVGSSLTRSSSSKKQSRLPRIRWHSFARCHRPCTAVHDHYIATMSAGQIAVLHRICMLKVTATLEKHSPAHRTGRSWFVPRLMKRARTPDYSNRRVFGVPLSIIQQRHGQPLPQCVLYAMRRLRRSATDSESVGVFRKSGVRSRILALRNEIEADPDSVDFDNLASYDVADVLKLYFRELPECLLTNKLSHVFVSLFLHVPAEKRLDLLKATILLLPDGHRETLQSLLLFLSDMAKHAEHNQMNARNLAICFAPSLFHLCGCWKVNGADGTGSSSAKRSGSSHGNSRRGAETGMLTEKDLAEQRASHECLTCMITNSKDLFTLPQEIVDQCHLTYIEQGDPVSLEELVERHSRGDARHHAAYIDSCIQGLLKESRDKFKGWVSVTSSTSELDDVDLAYKKVGDGHPLRLWKSCVDVEAPPVEVLDRVLRERHLWDDDVIKWRVVERLDSQTEVFQYVVNAMVPHPTRDFCELRSWRVDLPNRVCVLVSTSVEHKDAPLMGGVRGVTLASRYLIEPCGSGKSRLTHIARVDLRGRTPDWYLTVYGRWFTNYARRIRSSFQTNVGAPVQETNV